MKFLLALSLTFASSYLLACPNLTGNYSCSLGSHAFNKDIITTATGYSVNTDGVEMEYVTDGSGREIPSTDSYKDAIVKSSCKDDKFIIDFSAAILYEGSVIAHQASHSEYSMNGEDMIIVQKTKMKGIPLPTNTYKCVKTK